MLNKVASVIQRHCFWLALFCHCLLFSGVSLVWVVSPKSLDETKDKPALFIPSYVYQDAPAVRQPSPIETPAPQQEAAVSNTGIEKPLATLAHLAFNRSHPIDISRTPETEPVHLIGDKKMDRPLLTLLGKALTKHLVYPKSAIDLNVKGTSVIGFLLYPDGHITDVQLLRTSRAEVLDNAALAAAKAIGSVSYVGQYLAKPQFMVIGIIFE